MGYTNYWDLEKTKFPTEFLEDVKKIINASIVDIVGWDGEEGSEPTITENEISLNGLVPEDYESFVLGGERGFNFCKTARMPYDEVVKAVLILAEHYGIVSNFRFDGDKHDQEYLMAKMLLKSAGIDVEEKKEKRLIDIFEEHGFTVSGEDGCWYIRQYTPEEEDWGFVIGNLEDVVEYAESFDEEEEFEVLVKANISGKPSISKLWQDQLWKKEVLENLAMEIRK